MRTRAIALAVLVCSGAAPAQDPLGNDSGPNTNDGRCDDARFENIDAGNSNIVLWEGGRYDGRDVIDCADLLLQGLIAWRRDYAVAEVPAEPDMSTVAEARQQQATSIAPTRPSDPLCTDTADEPCWMELDDLPDCYVWHPYPQLREIDSWFGECSDGLGTVTVVYRIDADEGTVEFPYVDGVLHDTVVFRLVNGTAGETPWVNGEIHGKAI